MSEKKVCHWLNTKENGVIVLRENYIAACCTRELMITDNSNYASMSLEEIQGIRTQFFDKMNSKSSPCKGCGYLHEKKEEDIEIGKVGYVIYHPHRTCNLKCIYCSYAKCGDTLKKLDREKTDSYKVISHFHDIGLFKDDFTFEYGGGEPLLLSGISESVDLLSNYYPKSSVLFVSNFTLTKEIDKLIPTLAKRKIKSVLKTSVDCGTRKTYKKIRGKDLFDTLRNNLLKAAKNNAFDEIQLKYIFLDNLSNSSNRDINGFIKLAKEIKKANPNTTTVVLDADNGPWFESGFTKDEMLPPKALKAARKIYKECSKFGCQPKFIGERLSYSSQNRTKQIKCIQGTEKIKDITILQQIFSVKNEGNHKVVRILGLKLKFRRRKND